MTHRDVEKIAHAFALLDGFVDEGAIPGAAAVVTYRGRVVGTHYTGVADPATGRLVQDDTLFCLASLTKPVTAATLLALVEQGRCALDDPLRQIVPAARTIVGSEGITLRHLLTHTSGLPGFAPDDGALRAAQAPLDAFFAAYLRCPVGFTPGTAFRYSNAGVHLQAAAIARLSGQDYHRAVARLLLQPLALENSFIPVPPDQWPRVAAVADPAFAGTPHEQFNTPYHRTLGIPWGGLYATATDVSRFLTYMLAAWFPRVEPLSTMDGPLSRTTRRTMTSAQAAVPPAAPHPADDLNVQERAVVEWGWGWEIKGTAPHHYTGSQTSSRTFSHVGASGTMMWADPVSGLGCVLLTNRALRSGWASVPPRHALFSDAVVAACVANMSE